MLKHDLSKSDREFRAAFEAGAFAPADFSHRAHVRLAYVYLAESDVDLALERMRAALVMFLSHHGIPAIEVSRDADARLAPRASITSCIARRKLRRPTISSRAIRCCSTARSCSRTTPPSLLFSDAGARGTSSSRTWIRFRGITRLRASMRHRDGLSLSD